MKITSANKFWLSLSRQDILKGNVGIRVHIALPTDNSIIESIQPFNAATNFSHPVMPKYKDLYLMVCMKSDKNGRYGHLDEYGNRYYYDSLRKGVESDYCNFYYDSNKYNMKLITSAHNDLGDSSSVTILSEIFKPLKSDLYKILDVYVENFVESGAMGLTYNVKIRYLEKK